MPGMTAIIFSKDRPLQLDGLLRSFYLHCSDADLVSVKVLYKTIQMQDLYKQVARDWPDVRFVQEEHFKGDLLAMTNSAACLLFLVDDTIFVGDWWAVDIAEYITDHPNVLGFSLRLGRNTTYCYTLDKFQVLPQFRGKRILEFDWIDADGDFAYPLELSSSLYRREDLALILKSMDYTSPNTLETVLARMVASYQGIPCLACFEKSVAFAFPANVVQTDWLNRSGGLETLSADNLARMYREGMRMDAGAYSGFVPEACHQEVELRIYNAKSCSHNALF